MIAKEFGLPLDAWMTGRRTLWETQLQEKCCCPHVESCYISCYATEPASQPASLLHWFEVNAVTLVPTQPAAHLIGLMSPLLSFPLFFFFFFLSLPYFLCFPALSVISPSPPSCLMKRGWWRQREVMRVCEFSLGVQVVLSLALATVRSISVYLSSCQPAWLFACLSLCFIVRVRTTILLSVDIL